MANAGEKIFSTKGRKTQRFSFTPLPPGEYNFKVRGSTAAIGCKPEASSIPYVKVQLEAENTGTDESGGRNKLVFHMLFLNTTPTDNGFVLTDKGGQIVDLVHAAGEEPDFTLVDYQAKVKVGGTRDNPVYDMADVEILDPQQVKQWVLDHDGLVVKGRSKMRKRDDGTQEAIIDFFIAPEEASEGGNSNPFDTEEEEAPAKVTAIKKPAPTPAKKTGTATKRR